MAQSIVHRMTHSAHLTRDYPDSSFDVHYASAADSGLTIAWVDGPTAAELAPRLRGTDVKKFSRRLSPDMLVRVAVHYWLEGVPSPEVEPKDVEMTGWDPQVVTLAAAYALVGEALHDLGPFTAQPQGKWWLRQSLRDLVAELEEVGHTLAAAAGIDLQPFGKA
jgi:hypothetical protein